MMGTTMTMTMTTTLGISTSAYANVPAYSCPIR